MAQKTPLGRLDRRAGAKDDERDQRLRRGEPKIDLFRGHLRGIARLPDARRGHLGRKGAAREVFDKL